MTRKFELIFAYEDRTWDTEVVDIPEGEMRYDDYGDGCPANSELHEAAVDWAFNHLLTKPEYRKVVHVGVYNDGPEPEDF